MYKVFINDKPLFIQDNYQHNDNARGVFFLLYTCKSEINTVVNFLINQPEVQRVYLIHKDVEALWKDFKENFTIVAAAGGLVSDNNNRLLVIYRNGKWDLPKGKLEGDETTSEGAMREVEEECGIGSLEIKHFLSKTYHTYRTKEKDILKETSWYKMHTTHAGNLQPQLEEGITEVKWIDGAGKEEILENTYPSLAELIQDY